MGPERTNRELDGSAQDGFERRDLHRVADDMATVAKDTGKPVKLESFNGVPVTAHPGETGRDVVSRYLKTPEPPPPSPK